jgi:hypothetical protein
MSAHPRTKRVSPPKFRRGRSEAVMFRNAFLKRFGKGTTPSAPPRMLRDISLVAATPPNLGGDPRFGQDGSRMLVRELSLLFYISIITGRMNGRFAVCFRKYFFRSLRIFSLMTV